MVFASEILERYSVPVRLENDRTYREIGIRSHGKGIFHKKETTAKDIGNKRVFWLKPNTLVLNIVFAWERALAITSKNEKGFIASHRFPMYEAKDNCNLSFLLRYFLNPRGNFELQLASPGGAGRNRTLGQEAFQKVRVPLPPLSEQERIAKILNTWDEAISKQTQLIALKEKRKRGLMQKLLTGEVRFREFVKEEGFKKTKIGLIPKDWEVVRLSDLVDNRKESFNDGDWIESKYIEGSDIRLIQTGNIGIGHYKEKNKKRYITLDTFHKLKCSEIFFGDILICRLAEPAGRACIFPKIQKRAITSVDVSIYRPNNFLVNKSFLVQWFSTKKWFDSIASRCGGSTRSRIGRIELGKSRIPFPPHPTKKQLAQTMIKNIIFGSFIFPLPKSEQQKIADILSLADKEINQLKIQLEALKEQKRGLMQVLLTGKVRVKV